MDLKCLVYLFAVFSLSKSDSDQEDPKRVIGGKLCKLKQFPYVVVVLIEHELIQSNYQCTGSIIAGKWVITAANCYRYPIIDKGGDLNTAVTTVIAGTVDYDVKNEESQERTSVRHIVHERHPDHQNSAANWDIALVEVSEPFNFTEFVNKITMAKFPREAENLHSTSVGFGTTNKTHPSSNSRMFYIKTTTTAFMFCEKVFTWKEEHLCVEPVKKRTSLYYGDSGGPLIYRRFQVGVDIGTLTETENTYHFYEIYSKVSFFEDWIRQHVPEIPPMEQLPLEIDELRSEKRSSASSATVAGVFVLTIAFWLSILVGSDRTSA